MGGTLPPIIYEAIMTPTQIATIADLFTTLATELTRKAGTNSQHDDDASIGINIRHDGWGKTTLNFRVSNVNYLASTPKVKAVGKVKKSKRNWSHSG